MSPVAHNFADRLIEAIQRTRAPVCVGLDPVYERLPAAVREKHVAPCPAILEFGRGIIEAVADLVPALKINSAFFECHHACGIQTYDTLVREARLRGLLVIGDIKRADVGHSTDMYARAHLGGVKPESSQDGDLPDAVTVNPYLGVDGVQPFMEAARANGRGLFVLVQTSNPSAKEVQQLKLADGGTVAERVASLVALWGAAEGLVGQCGYSAIGAVVAPQEVELTRRLRVAMPQSVFLVPGFGAQGKTAREVALCFKKDGTGAIINASRSVIYAHDDAQYAGQDWKSAVAAACREFVSQAAKCATAL
jgi:orotidine-5'-phosphate decarboxylase